MITVDNYEVETCGNRDTIMEDCKALVHYFGDSVLDELHNLIIRELRNRYAKNNSDN